MPERAGFAQNAAAVQIDIRQIPKVAHIIEHAARNAVFLRQAQWEFSLKPGRHIKVAAQRIIDRATDVARADAAGFKSADHRWANHETVGHPVVPAAPGQGTALKAGTQGDFFVKHTFFAGDLCNRLDVFAVATQSGKILAELHQNPGCRVKARAAGIIGIFISQSR